MAKKIQWNVSTKWIWKGKDIPQEAKDKLLQLDEFKWMDELPSDIVYFEGVVSNGDKNRNGYKIESNAWFFDKWKYVKDFLATWSVLYNHNDNEPIGRPLAFELAENWDDVNVAWYVWDDLVENRFWRKLIMWLSTGHITHESVYENTDTKQRVDSKDFWDLIWSDNKVWDEYWNWLWDWIVTKAEIAEFSPVGVRSNRWATMTNGVWPDQENFGIKIPKGTTKEQAKNLFFNQFAMKYKKNADGTDMLDPTTWQPIPEENDGWGEGGDGWQGGGDGDNTPNTPADTPDTPATPTTDENSIKINWVAIEKNELQKLVNTITKEVEKNFADKMKVVEDSNTALSNKLQEVEASLNALKDEKRDWLNALVPNGTDGKKQEKTIAEVIREKNEAKNS